MSDPHADIADRLERCFHEIEQTRMAGVPILNRALRVKAVGVRDWSGDTLGVLVTPWFMNLMLLPGDPRKQAASEETAQIGEKRLFPFPAGAFEFIRGHEEAIGPYWMCSLFSPVFEFADQETAEAAANAALDELMRTEDAPSERDAEMAAIWRGERPEPEHPAIETGDGGEPDAEAPMAAELSRRNLLRGKLRDGDAASGEEL